MATLSLAQLTQAVAGSAVAIRAVTRLEPAGGPGDKIFPPTYMKEGKAQTKYALERRRIDGQEVDTVLLDSVASQANRMEEALLEGFRRGELRFPLVEVDFTNEEGLQDLGKITSLQAPHRIADALLRDSLLDGRLFRLTEVGQAFTDSRPAHATGAYKYCPTALVFGVWDSTGPKGGMGSKFQRCLVSEIVGISVTTGVKTASRIDPAEIQREVGKVYKHRDAAQEWTIFEAEAAKEGGKPAPFARKGSEGKGVPSAVNHGNIPPTIDAEAGGVTMDHARQTIVLSLAGLRRLRFSTNCANEPIPEGKLHAAMDAARTALAALGLAAVVFQRSNGFDLRSRSLLVATQPLVFELLRDDGSSESFSLSREEAAELLADAESQARQFGLGWSSDPIVLKPAPKLAQLIRLSRAARQAGDAEDAG